MKSAIITLERCGFFANIYIPIKKQLRKSGSNFKYAVFIAVRNFSLTNRSRCLLPFQQKEFLTAHIH